MRRALLKITIVAVAVLACRFPAGAWNKEGRVIHPEGGDAGFSIAVLGGSLSVCKESDVAKGVWADALGADVVTYGVGGAGFCRTQGHSLQIQAEEAGVHDVYVLWASTNDYNNRHECGTPMDWTAADGFAPEALDTQCGGINYCIHTLKAKNPDAVIVFFTSLPFFRSEDAWRRNAPSPSMAFFVNSQKKCCSGAGVKVLDQFGHSPFSPSNYIYYYKKDKLHLTEKGYEAVTPMQLRFLRRIVRKIK